MLQEIALGCALMIATTFIHAGCTGLLLRVLRRIHAGHWSLRHFSTAALVVCIPVALLFLAGLVEAGLWALTYLRLGALETPEEAMYFSVVTYTTLGFGDVTMSQAYRLLSAFEAANGIIMFGWSTALVFAFVQHMAQLRLTSGQGGAR